MWEKDMIWLEQNPWLNSCLKFVRPGLLIILHRLLWTKFLFGLFFHNTSTMYPQTFLGYLLGFGMLLNLAQGMHAHPFSYMSCLVFCFSLFLGLFSSNICTNHVTSHWASYPPLSYYASGIPTSLPVLS